MIRSRNSRQRWRVRRGNRKSGHSLNENETVPPTPLPLSLKTQPREGLARNEKAPNSTASPPSSTVLPPCRREALCALSSWSVGIRARVLTDACGAKRRSCFDVAGALWLGFWQSQFHAIADPIPKPNPKTKSGGDDAFFNGTIKEFDTSLNAMDLTENESDDTATFDLAFVTP